MTSSISARVILIYPPFDEIIRSRCGAYTASSLGLQYLSASLKQEGHEVEGLDCSVFSLGVAETAQRIQEYGPDVVGVSVTSPSTRFVKELISELRGRGVTSSICVGGSHVSADPTSSALLGADVLFTGEAEAEFTKYCGEAVRGKAGSTAGTDNYLCGAPPDRIDCGRIEDLDCLPLADRSLFNAGRYRFTAVAASRGCPFSCIYCSLCGSGHRKRGIDSVAAELNQLASMNVSGIDFADDVFTLDRPYARAISEKADEAGLGWACTTRADLVDRNLICYLAQRGCDQVSFGVESGVKKIRADAGKNITDERIRAAFKACRKEGVKTRAYAMLGLPGDDTDSMEETIEFVESLGADSVLYSPVTAYPGTKIFSLGVAEGRVDEDAWEKYMVGMGEIPYYTPPGVDLEEVAGLCFEATQRFYMQPTQIMRRFLASRSVAEAADAVKAGIAYLAGAGR